MTDITRIAATPIQKVVVVNGNTEVLGMLEAVLEAGRYDMVFVESSDHAYAQIKKVLPNLVILCPNCHKMLDLDLISNETIIQMRDRPKVVSWSKRMKDAGQKAALTRLRRAQARQAVTSAAQVDPVPPGKSDDQSPLEG